MEYFEGPSNIIILQSLSWFLRRLVSMLGSNPSMKKITHTDPATFIDCFARTLSWFVRDVNSKFFMNLDAWVGAPVDVRWKGTHPEKIRVDPVLQGSLSKIGYLYKSTKHAIDSCDKSCEWFDVVAETPSSVFGWITTADADSGIRSFQHKTLGNWCKWSPNGQSLRFWFRRNPQLLILTSPLSAFQFNSFEISDSEAAEICPICAIVNSFLQSVCNEST